MTDWKNWSTNPPKPGDHIILLADDGCSTACALVVDWDGAGTPHALHGEDGFDLTESGFTDGALWAEIPDDYPLALLETDDQP